MSITHNGKEYGATKVINYSAAPDYNRGITVDNIQSGNYQATDNGFLFIQLQSQQSNPTKVSVIRSKTPITDTGTEIASRILQQYQYSETLTAQVMAREYYKLIIEGAGNPQVISCRFYPYTSNVPIKLTEDISIGQVAGLEDELDGKQDAGDYATNTALNNGLNSKQDKGNYFNKDTDILNKKNGGLGEELTFQNPRSIFRVSGSGGEDINSLACPGIRRSTWNTNNTPTTNWSGQGYLIDFNWVEGMNGYATSGYGCQYFIYPTGSVYKRYRASSAFKEWKLIENSDGSIPADIISPTVLKYENSDGTWTETKLTTGEVVLEGWGLSFNGGNEFKATIVLPKTLKKNSIIVAMGVYFGLSGWYGTSNGFIQNTSTVELLLNVPENQVKMYQNNWYIKGILA